MRVVSNTTPLNYLVLIGAVEVLPELFQTVIVPEAVMRELTDTRSPDAVRAWALQPPGWLGVRSPTTVPPAGTERLQAGEREAITLALELDADLLLVDELLARQEAGRRSIRFTGTLGILGRASQRGLIDVRDAVARLRQTSFRMTDALARSVLEQADTPTSGSPSSVISERERGIQ